MLILEIAAGIVLGFVALATIELWVPLVIWLVIALIGLAVLAAVVIGIMMLTEKYGWQVMPIAVYLGLAAVGAIFITIKGEWHKNLNENEDLKRAQATSDSLKLEAERQAADERARAAWAEFDRLRAEKAKRREPLTDEEMIDRLLDGRESGDEKGSSA